MLLETSPPLMKIDMETQQLIQLLGFFLWIFYYLVWQGFN